MNRRGFFAASAGMGLASFASRQDRPYRTALLGSGWWGMNILREAMRARRSKIVAVADVDPRALESSAEEIEAAAGSAPAKYPDFRELLEREKPEIAIVATPDHWHALMALSALKAGAHVFLEKPTGHTILESSAIVKAARDEGRTVQVGLHRRVGPHYVSGIKFLKEGRAGRIGMVRMFVAGGGGSERPTPNRPPPKGMNWDLYCGPAPLRPFNSKIHPGGFRNFLDFANGTLGDWGVHWLDQVLWWSEEKFPRRVFSTGGRPVRGAPVSNEKEQTTDAPDSQVAAFEFESFTAVWEHRAFAQSDAEKHKIGCYFYGTKGTFHMGWRDGWTFYPSDGGAPLHEASRLEEPDGHNIPILWSDFLEAIDKNKRPAADIESGHRATAAALLGMLSWKLGRSVAWDARSGRIAGDEAANALLARPYRAPWEYPKG